jgi:hypothetical protein
VTGWGKLAAEFNNAARGMTEEKELLRVMAIVQAHARTALAKETTQRASFLGYCRSNWKRYAAGLSKRPAECERFAAILDRATRDLIALAETDPDVIAAVTNLHAPWRDTPDAVEGAMDSVITHEAHQEPEIVAAPVAAAPVAVEESAAPAAEIVVAPPPRPEAKPIDVDATEQLHAEVEDRVSARYGFERPGASEVAAPVVEPPEHARELQRRIRSVLMSLQREKADAE